MKSLVSAYCIFPTTSDILDLVDDDLTAYIPVSTSVK